ncbi:hypothetical protein [Streptomyces sp. BPTC-684]|uniref:hypothetical protein n=1 Tax=Streptomyces sp. BPTC-684 TaxID=3043734 RepID=UPI0024B0B96A|nr:hypothetical protein [Streptomyces sp. BPTC-684]WHM40849.1 hypothetical protein QIY60_30870 [Streptomyces sp. BPTC-684]
MRYSSRIGRRSAALASAALLSVGLGTAMATQAHAAAAASVIIYDGYSQTVQRESAGTPVSCPTNQVLLGREHHGDENGSTTYYCGLIIIDGQLVQVGAPNWSGSQRESNSFFTAPGGEALVGRVHSGDENGYTRYATASLTVGGRPVDITSYRWTGGQTESSSYSRASDGEVMVGRSHYGDEKGQTTYEYAKVS